MNIFPKIIFLILMIYFQLLSQNLHQGNPANVFDPKGSFLNPSLISFKYQNFFIGVTAFQMGFISKNPFSIRNNYIGTSFKKIIKNFDFGFIVENFNTPLLDENRLNLIISKKLNPNFAVGLSYKIVYESFKRENFKYFDVNDPVIYNLGKFYSKIGVGLLYNTNDRLFIGLNIDNLNQPNVALMEENLSEDIYFNFGLFYQFKNFTTGISLNYYNNKIKSNFLIAYRLFALNKLIVNYFNEFLRFEGKFELNNNWDLDYRYDYPISEIQSFSSGSSDLSLIHSSLSNLALDVFLYGENIIGSEKDKLLLANIKKNNKKPIEKIEIVKTNIQYELNSQNEKPFLNLAPNYFPVFALKDVLNNYNLYFLSSKFKTHYFRNDLLEKYDDEFWIKNLSYLSQKYAVKIYVPQGKEENLNYFFENITKNKVKDYKYLDFYYFQVNQLPISKLSYLFEGKQIIKTEIKPSILIFNLVSESRVIEKDHWELIVKDPDNNIVFKYRGFGIIPSILKLDSNQFAKKILKVGSYSYQIIVNKFKSPEKYFRVNLVKKSIKVLVSTKEIKNMNVKSLNVLIN